MSVPHADPLSGEPDRGFAAGAGGMLGGLGIDVNDVGSEPGHEADGSFDDEPLRPVNWNTLTAEEARVEWLDLNSWVDWLRTTYGLPPAVVPPLWHRHDELVWELSALHLHWLQSYDPESSASSPLVWHRDFAEARNRLREWVATCGTRLDRDRPTRQTTWPGETAQPAGIEQPIEHRDRDFAAFVNDDLARRRAIEATASEVIRDSERRDRGGR